MINIKHCHTADTIISYSSPDVDYDLVETMKGNMDEIAEHCCEVLVRHCFNYATVIESKTGNLLLEVTKS